MNPFRKLGRQVEQFTSKAKEAAEADARFRCAECGEHFGDRRERCPECDSADVVAIDSGEGS